MTNSEYEHIKALTKIVNRYDVSAMANKMCACSDSSHSGGETKTVLCTLCVCNTDLPCPACWISSARIFKSLSKTAWHLNAFESSWRLLRKGGCNGDRNNNST